MPIPLTGRKEFFPAAWLDMAEKASEEVYKGTLFLNSTSSVLKRKGYYQKIRHPEGYMDPRGYVDLAQDLLNWFDLKDVKI